MCVQIEVVIEVSKNKRETGYRTESIRQKQVGLKIELVKVVTFSRKKTTK